MLMQMCSLNVFSFGSLQCGNVVLLFLCAAFWRKPTAKEVETIPKCCILTASVRVILDFESLVDFFFMVVSFIRPRLRSLTGERENLLSLVETQVSSESVMYYFGVATGNLLVVCL